MAHEGHGHGGINTTRTLINKHFTWPEMVSDIKAHISRCTICAKHNKSGAVKTTMLPPEMITQRGEKLALDIVGPLPLSKQNFRYILTAMELVSGFPFAIPLRYYTAEHTAQGLLAILSFKGTPLAILTSRAPTS